MEEQQAAARDAEAAKSAEAGGSTEEGLDGMTLGLIIGGAALALILIITSIVCIMKRKNKLDEVQKYPLSADDSTIKSNYDMPTNHNVADGDMMSSENGLGKDDKGSELELESMHSNQSQETPQKKLDMKNQHNTD